MTPELQALIEQLYPSKRFKDRDDQSRPLFLMNTQAVASALVERLSRCANVEVNGWSVDEEATRCVGITMWFPSGEAVTRFMHLPPPEQHTVLQEHGGIYWYVLSFAVSNVGPFYQYGLLGYREPGSQSSGSETLHTPAGWSGGVRPDDRLEVVSRSNSAPTVFWKDIIEIAETILQSAGKRVLAETDEAEEVPWLDIRGSDLEEAGNRKVTVCDCFFGLS